MSMVIDEETGRTYLFGGVSDRRWTGHVGESSHRPYADLWELRVDVPGSDFRDSELEPGPHFASPGPFRTCFNCGRTCVLPMCAVSCYKTESGVAFCQQECQDAGWAKHKAISGCRKS